MTDPIPDEAVEAAARALCVVTNYGTLGPRCDTHEWVVPIADPTHCEYGDEIARAALTAALPHIEAAFIAHLTDRAKALQVTEPSPFGDGWNSALRALAATTSLGDGNE